MGVAHFEDVVAEGVCELAVVVEVILAGHGRGAGSLPGTEMNFVNVHRGLLDIGFRAVFEPCGIGPGERFRIGDDSRVGWAQFRAPRIGIEFGENIAVFRTDFIRERQIRFCVAAAVPAVEVSDDGDAFGVGRPDGEADSACTVDGDAMRAHHLVNLAVFAGVEEMDVHLADSGEEGIRIAGTESCFVREVFFHFITEEFADGKFRGEETVGVDFFQDGGCPGVVAENLDGFRHVVENADDDISAGGGVHAEHGMRIGHASFQQRTEFFGLRNQRICFLFSRHPAPPAIRDQRLRTSCSCLRCARRRRR